MNKDRIREIADALEASNGQDSAGASTGERIASALVVGHPEWAGYTLPDGRVDVLAAVSRLGRVGVQIVRQSFDER